MVYILRTLQQYPRSASISPLELWIYDIWKPVNIVENYVPVHCIKILHYIIIIKFLLRYVSIFKEAK